MAPRRARAIQWLSNTVLRATPESRSSTIGHISLDRKQAGKPSARNGHARFEAAGTENQLTIRLVRHSQRKRGATDRSNLRSLASVLDPTDRGDSGNVGIIRSPLRATVLPDCGGHQATDVPTATLACTDGSERSNFNVWPRTVLLFRCNSIGAWLS